VDPGLNLEVVNVPAVEEAAHYFESILLTTGIRRHGRVMEYVWNQKSTVVKDAHIKVSGKSEPLLCGRKPNFLPSGPFNEIDGKDLLKSTLKFEFTPRLGAKPIVLEAKYGELTI
jgi:hypothetical protein